MDIIHYPFIPGIPWKLRKDKSLNLDLNLEEYVNLWDKHDIYIFCNSGLLDCFLSLALCEYGNSKLSNNFFTILPNQFKNLVTLNKLSCFSTKYTVQDLVKYPTPIIKINNDIIFNTSFNIENKIDYQGNIIGPQKLISYSLVLNNLFLKQFVIPKLRKLSWDPKLYSWSKINKIQLEKPFVLMLPDILNVSNSNIPFLDWSLQEIKGFNEMLKSVGYNLIIMSNTNFYHSGLTFIEYSLENFLNLTTKCSLLLAKEIDFLGLGLLISDATICASKYSYRYSIDKIKDTFQSINKLVSLSNIKPINIFNELFQ